MSGRQIQPPTARRLDQWLWFARFSKTRSLAARLCASGEVLVNGLAVRKPNHAVRPGDAVVVPQGRVRRSVRVLGLGIRRGPAAEARRLYEDTAPAAPLEPPPWRPLLGEDGEP